MFHFNLRRDDNRERVKNLYFAFKHEKIIKEMRKKSDVCCFRKIFMNFIFGPLLINKNVKR